MPSWLRLYSRGTSIVATALSIVLALSVATFFVRASAGEAGAPSGALARQEGFVPIFNGRDLDGWAGLPDYWSVRDGAIFGQETLENSKDTFLVFTRFELGELQLRLKYKFLTSSGNSGVQFRSKVLDRSNWTVGGYQADLDAEGGYDGSLYDQYGVAGGRNTLSKQGVETIWDTQNQHKEILLSETAEQLRRVIRVGDWNELEITAFGKCVVYKINGHVMTKMKDESYHFLKSGSIALQLHSGFTMGVLFKDIMVKKLSGDDEFPQCN